MNTPITDAASVNAGECYHTAEVLHSDVARRLELDRAALMEALERIKDATLATITADAAEELCDIVFEFADNALAAARANFP